MKKITALFKWIAEPRVQRSAYFIIYILHVIAGLAIAIGQPPAVAREIGEWPMIMWGAFLIVGGIVGAVAVLPGWNYIERIAILSVLVGVALTSVVIVATPWSSAATQLSVWALVTGWLVVFGLRSYEIRYYTVAPRIGG